MYLSRVARSMRHGSTRSPPCYLQHNSVSGMAAVATTQPPNHPPFDDNVLRSLPTPQVVLRISNQPRQSLRDFLTAAGSSSAPDSKRCGCGAGLGGGGDSLLCIVVHVVIDHAERLVAIVAQQLAQQFTHAVADAQL